MRCTNDIEYTRTGRIAKGFADISYHPPIAPYKPGDITPAMQAFR